MSVELINNNPNEILDLTGGEDATSATEIQEGEESTLDTTLEVDGTESIEGGNTDTSSGGSDDAGDSDGSDSADDSADTTDAVDVEEVEYFFGDTQVVVEVPDEISTALTEAGIDQKELLGQLFKKDGDFSLDDDMRSKLESKFGKTMVDGYLNMYKTTNEQAAQRFANDAKVQADLEKEQGEQYAKAVGGEEGLVLMEDYITKNFNDEQIAAYNAVMENGDFASQMLIISQVKQMQDMADKLQNGDKSISLVGDKDSANSGISSPLDKGYLTNEEYNDIMNDDKYWTDKGYMAKVDAARMAGFKHDA